MKKQLAVFIGGALVLCSPVTAFASTKNAVHYETKAQFVQAFLEHYHVSPDKRGISPFSDVPTKSTAWGYVHKATELHLISPSSKHQFGGNVTHSQAASIAANYYHMQLSGQSPLSWANSQGLLSGSQNATYLTSSDANNFFKALDQLKTALKFADSWTLTPDEATILSQAFSNFQSATAYQQQSKLVDTTNVVLTKTGLQDLGPYPATVETTNDSLQFGSISGGKAYYEVNSDQTGSDPATTNSYFVENGNLYVNNNDGSGWTADSQDYSSYISGMSNPFVDPSWLQDVTAKQTQSGYTFSVKLNQKVLLQEAEAIVSGMGSQDLSAAAMKKLTNDMITHGSLTLTINVGMDQNTYNLASANMLFQSSLPESDIPWPSGTNLNQMEKFVSEMTIHETDAYTFAFDTTPMTPPSDFTLPSGS